MRIYLRNKAERRVRKSWKCPRKKSLFIVHQFVEEEWKLLSHLITKDKTKFFNLPLVNTQSNILLFYSLFQSRLLFRGKVFLFSSFWNSFFFSKEILDCSTNRLNVFPERKLSFSGFFTLFDFPRESRISKRFAWCEIKMFNAFTKSFNVQHHCAQKTTNWLQRVSRNALELKYYHIFPHDKLCDETWSEWV